MRKRRAMNFDFTRDVVSRLDFMAVPSGAQRFLQEKGSGVLEGEVETRVTRQNRAEPQERDHCRSNVTND